MAADTGDSVRVKLVPEVDILVLLVNDLILFDSTYSNAFILVVFLGDLIVLFYVEVQWSFPWIHLQSKSGHPHDLRTDTRIISHV